MTLTTGQAVASILVMAAVTFLTRAIPFIFFGGKNKPPAVVIYLGQVLPPAIIAMLIIYCLRSIQFSELSGWLPMVISSVVVVALHRWKHNDLLSIFSGTALYMILVQVVFA